MAGISGMAPSGWPRSRTLQEVAPPAPAHPWNPARPSPASEKPPFLSLQLRPAMTHTGSSSPRLGTWGWEVHSDPMIGIPPHTAIYR